MVNLIAAYGNNRELGKDGHIPWHLSGDFKHVREVTKDSILIMGQKTFESLKGVLPGRTHIVLTDDPNFTYEHERVHIVRDIKLAMLIAKMSGYESFVFGGASIYKQFLPTVERMYLTHVNGEYDADVYFPEWDESKWDLIEESETFVENGTEYVFRTYERKGLHNEHAGDNSGSSAERADKS